MVAVNPLTAATAGFTINSNGGAYKPGHSYGMLKKIELVEKYEELQILANGVPPSIRSLAAAVQVSRGWASKVIRELQSEGGLVDPDYTKPQRLKGPGIRLLDSFDTEVLLLLLRSNPSRSLPNYQRELFHITGTLVSKSTICRYWKYGFEISAALRRPNLVPVDKFKPENIDRAVEYLQIVLRIDPRRLKFCDEKSLKGEEIRSLAFAALIQQVTRCSSTSMD